MSTNNCPSCGASIALNTTECKYCGESITVPQQQQQQYQAPQYIPPQAPVPPAYNAHVPTSNKSKVAAGILAILLGGFGIHKFYLGRVGWGIVYLLFCWTYIPSLVGLIEGIIYLTSSDQSFQAKYGRR